MSSLDELLDDAEIIDVSLDSIITNEDAFQFRNILADGIDAPKQQGKSIDHISALADSVKKGVLFDPILVIKSDVDTSKYIVVDGHHRVKAYKKTWKGKKGKKIPIKVLPARTTTDEATLLSLLANKDDKLPMTSRQKTEAAWKLLCTNKMVRNAGSLRKVSKTLKDAISHVTIGKMLKHYKKLTDAGESTEGMWIEHLRGNLEYDDDYDEEQRRQERKGKLDASLTVATVKIRGMHPDDVLDVLHKVLWERGYDLRGKIAHCYDEDAEYDDEDSDF